MFKNWIGILIFLAATALASSGFSQPRIGVEISGGAGVGFNPYVDNVVILDSDVPVLVDELPGPGIHFRLSFLFGELELFGGVNLFNRTSVIQHHRATSTISPRNRLRPDGTIDDSGVEYLRVDDTTVNSNSNKGDLLFVRLGGGYRFYLLNDEFRFYIPAAGGLAFLTILEPAKPLKTGVFLETGFGLSFDIAEPISVFFDGRITGTATPSYAPISDAARTSFLNDESTESTLFSSFLSSSFLIGFQIAIR